MGKEYEWSPAILDTSPNNEETRNFRRTFVQRIWKEKRGRIIPWIRNNWRVRVAIVPRRGHPCRGALLARIMNGTNLVINQINRPESIICSA